MKAIQVLDAFRTGAAWLCEPINAQVYLGFRRVISLYYLLIYLSSFSCVLATLQTFIMLRPRTSMERLGQTLLIISFLTSFMALVITTMLLFCYEFLKDPLQIDLIVAYSPIVLFDVSAILLLTGTLYLSRQRTGYWCGRIVAGALVGLLGLCSMISFLVAWRMSSSDGQRK